MIAITVRIGEAAKMLGVTVQTLRNWEKSGRLVPQRSPGKQRQYLRSDIEQLALDLPKLAWAWAASAQPAKIPDEYSCDRSDRFTGRLEKMNQALNARTEKNAADLASLLTAVAGEIGDNSFAHNLGSWPDEVGVFFAYDLRKRIIVLADRGQGIRATLQRVRPSIASDAEALRVAFTETISSRSPEKRGNGLKIVKQIAERNPIGLWLQSGIAQINLPPHGKMRITASDKNVRGVVAVVTF